MKSPFLFLKSGLFLFFLMFCFPVLAQEESENEPYLFVYGQNEYTRNGIISLASTDEPMVHVEGDAISDVTVDVYRSGISSVLEFLRYAGEEEQLNFEPKISEMEKVVSISQPLGRFNLPLEESGIYLLHAYSGNTSLYTFVIRSTFGTIAKEGDNAFLFWTQDFRTKRSLPDAHISVYGLREKISEKEKATSDKDGIATTKLSGEHDVAVVEHSGSYAIVPLNLSDLNRWNYRPYEKRFPAQRFFLFTDRPLYQPGDTIHFKSIAREDDDVRLSILKGTVRVELFSWDTERSVIYSQNYTFSENGSISGEIHLPEDVRTTAYSLAVYPEDSNDEYEYYSRVDVSVEYYDKPEFGLDVELLSDSEIISGEEISLKIRSEYFSGEPVSGGAVSYTVTESEYYDYGFYEEDSANAEDRYFYGYYYGTEILSDTIDLNKKGEATLSFLANNETLETKIYGIEMTLESETGEQVVEYKNVLVRNADFGIYRSNDVWGGVVNQKQLLELKLRAFRDISLKNIPLSVHVEYDWWEKVQGAESSLDTYDSFHETLDDWEVTTDGKGLAEVEFIPRHEGSYKIVVTGTDERGNAVEEEFYLWIRKETGYSWYGDMESTGLNINLEKETYAPGETMRFFVGSAVEKRDVLLTFEREFVHRYKVISLSKGGVDVEEKAMESDMPNMYLSVSAFDDYALNEDQREITIFTDSKKLDITIFSDKETYSPGETVNITLDVKDKGGNPQQAELTFRALDKAIFELSYPDNTDIFETFWFKRWHGTEDSHSLEGIGVDTAEKGGCFLEDTLVTLEDGSKKPIQDIRAGDRILTRKSQADPTLVGARVGKTFKQETKGYLLINDQLRVTPDHLLFVYDTWKRADQVRMGDVLVDEIGKTVPVRSVFWKKEITNVYNLEVPEYHSYFADGVWVHNGKGDEPRSVFEDMAYWNPTIQTDAQGKATISFVLPDNLTTWVLSAVGATKDTKVGTSTREISVTKDVILRPQIPRLLYLGDSLYLTALAQNFTQEKRTFDVSLEFEQGEVFEAVKQITLSSGESERIMWEVRPKNEAQDGSLVFSMRDKDDEAVSDSVKLSIPVLQHGFWETQSFVGSGEKEYPFSLHDNIHSEKTSVVLDISSTLTGSIPSAMKYLVEYPYGCVEQTTSRFVPVIIARENPDLYKEALEERDIDAMVKMGVTRLSDMQNEDGGWNWWGGGQEKSDLFVTAYVIEYLLRSQNAGFFVDGFVLGSAQSFFEEYVVDPMNEKTYGDYVLSVYGKSLFGMGGEKIDRLPGKLSSDLVAYAVMANVRNGYMNPSDNGANVLRAMLREEGDILYFDAGDESHFGSIFASTGLGLRALMMGGVTDREVLTGIVRYLTKNRTDRQWHNTFATAQVIEGLTDYARREKQTAGTFSYSVYLDEKNIFQGVFDSNNQSDTVSIPFSDLIGRDANLSLRITSGSGNLFSQFLVREYRLDMENATKSKGLTITRTYKNSKGDEYAIGVGDIVDIVLQVEGIRKDSQYVVVEDQLPSGMVPVNTRMKNVSQEDQEGRKPYYYDEWRVNKEYTKNGVVISDQWESESDIRIYTYKARVTHTGTFNVSPAFASLMYEPKVYGRTASETVEFKKESEYILKKESEQRNKEIRGISRIIVSLLALLIGSFVLILSIKKLYPLLHDMNWRKCVWGRKNEGNDTLKRDTSQNEKIEEKQSDEKENI